METDTEALWTGGGTYRHARQIPSPNFNDRPENTSVTLVVIHNISLPPNQFGGHEVEALFTNTLNPDEHPYYKDIAHVEVSAHFFIRRDGELIQFVSCQHRAWHAGKSAWQDVAGCNDYSIGIELEGCDTAPFTDIQYRVLLRLLKDLIECYPIQAVLGHEHIAPGRKTDPGPYFDWQLLLSAFPDVALPPISH